MRDFIAALTIDDALDAHTCAERANEKGLDKLDVFMNLIVCNTHCPLDFWELANFDNFSFFHDIYGIERHLNKGTGKLENCFLPRCARPQDEQKTSNAVG